MVRRRSGSPLVFPLESSFASPFTSPLHLSHNSLTKLGLLSSSFYLLGYFLDEVASIQPAFFLTSFLSFTQLFFRIVMPACFCIYYRTCVAFLSTESFSMTDLFPHYFPRLHSTHTSQMGAHCALLKLALNECLMMLLRK